VVVIHFAGMVWVTANQYNTLSHDHQGPVVQI